MRCDAMQEMKKKHSQWLEMEAALAAKQLELDKREADWRRGEEELRRREAERRKDEARNPLERDERLRVKGADAQGAKGEVGAAKAARRASETSSVLEKAAILRTPSPRKERRRSDLDSGQTAVATQLAGVVQSNGNAAKLEAERERMDARRAEWAREEKEWRKRLEEWRAKQAAWQQMQESVAREEHERSTRLREGMREEQQLLGRLERHRLDEAALNERVQALLWLEAQSQGASHVARTPTRGSEAVGTARQQVEFNRKFQAFLASLS
jgi:hypothetical protein